MTNTAATNNPKLAGTLAGRKLTFGDLNRYALAPVHTRFDSVSWFVWDSEVADPVTGFAGVIRQADTKEEALVGFPQVRFQFVVGVPDAS